MNRTASSRLLRQIRAFSDWTDVSILNGHVETPRSMRVVRHTSRASRWCAREGVCRHRRLYRPPSWSSCAARAFVVTQRRTANWRHRSPCFALRVECDFKVGPLRSVRFRGVVRSPADRAEHPPLRTRHRGPATPPNSTPRRVARAACNGAWGRVLASDVQ